MSDSPLCHITPVDRDVALGLWPITQTPDQFPALDEGLAPVYEELQAAPVCVSRQCEVLATHALLRRMVGVDARLSHLPSGQPVLPAGYVSISHTRGYAAMIYSPSKCVAIDIEYISERVHRIASKFLRADEPFVDTLSRLIVWCAKETAYKYYSADHLEYFDMQVLPFRLADGHCVVRHLPRGLSLAVTFSVTSSYVLTYAFQ